MDAQIEEKVVYRWNTTKDNDFLFYLKNGTPGML